MRPVLLLITVDMGRHLGSEPGRAWALSQCHRLQAVAPAAVESRCMVSGFVDRADLLSELGRAHACVYPTLHDSSSPARLEPCAMGRPTLTVGLGGSTAWLASSVAGDLEALLERWPVPAEVWL